MSGVLQYYILPDQRTLAKDEFELVKRGITMRGFVYNRDIENEVYSMSYKCPSVLYSLTNKVSIKTDQPSNIQILLAHLHEKM